MAPMTPMMAAIAAARKSEEKKRKEVVVGALSKPVKAHRQAYEPGDKVQYLSRSKGGWVDAVVRAREARDGADVYELNVKSGVALDKLRPRPGDAAGTSASGFVSFEAFDGRPSRKRGQGSDSEEDRKKAARPASAATPSGAPIVASSAVAASAAAGAAAAGAPASAAATAAAAAAVAERPVDWGDPPAELLPPESFPEEQPTAFIEHFVRFAIGAWRREQATGFVGFGELERAAFRADVLRDTEEAMAPLLQRLARGEKLEKGESNSKPIRRSGARTACDGLSVGEASVAGQLFRMASLAAAREYRDSHEAYMKLTLGNKRWNATIVTYVSANSMSGAREYRRNRDDLNTYDVDPVAQRYMQGMRKLVQFLQCVQPSADQSKNVLL